MLELKPPTAAEREAIAALYVRAFPANERRPLEPLMESHGGHAAMLAAREDGAFCGFVSLLLWQDIAHIIYFAVEEEKRGNGLGGRILDTVQALYPGCRVIVDIEEPEEKAANNPQRIRRKAFYLRNGYAETNIHYDWRGTDYAILSRGGSITDEEFGQFWDELAKLEPVLRSY